jgi:uncharacterized protein YjbI with pentapeptide repeats
MSHSSSRQCSYVYDPPGSVKPDDRVDVTRPEYEPCPHEVADTDESRCLFHQAETEYPSERFTEQFQRALVSETVSSTFSGGQLEGLDLAGETVTTSAGGPVDLRGALIHGDLDLRNATIEVPLLLDNASITGSIHAEDAEFHGPVSLVGANIDGIYCHGARIHGGFVANDLNTGYVDARGLTVDGPLILDRGTFASNLLIARGTVNGTFSLEGAEFDWSLDATSLSVAGDLIANDVSIDAECDCIAAEIGGDVELRKLEVSEETDWSHAKIAENLTVLDARFNSEASFSDVTINGEAAIFDGTQFTAKADFGTLTVREGRASFSDVNFGGEVWLTHATIGSVADFSRASFQGMAHLRDAAFEGDLVLRSIKATDQFFLHGSTIGGDCECTDASFVHFQFSATVHQKADFSGAQFDEKALFRSSTFGDRVWFDGAAFAGHLDFTDARFTGQTTFEETEFLVDPTFEDTRFAVTPDLSAATFPLADDIDLADRRKQMILAHPKSLRNEGERLPIGKINGEFSIPAQSAHLVEDDLTMTHGVAQALSDFDPQEWHGTFEEPLRTARTAVARLPDGEASTLVFALQLDTDGQPTADSIEDVLVAGVYCRHGDSIVFGHLDPAFIEADYLIPIPASDDAFESGAAVATSSELQKAAVRNERFRAALLAKQDGDEPPIHSLAVPVLVGAGTLGEAD